jgi:carbonic anhydrase
MVNLASLVISLLLTLATLPKQINSQERPPWNYDPTSPYGPEHWHEFYPKCGGQSQSPIDVVTSTAVLDDSLTDFDYVNYDVTSGTFLLWNTGHAIEVENLDSEIFISGGGLEYNFKLAHFHFHWGRDDTEGSEHLVDGESAAVEIHIVHWNVDLYSTFAEAAVSPDGIAVFGVFVQAAAENSTLSTGLGQLTTYFDQILHPGNQTDVPVFPMQVLLPQDRSYFRYRGSLTTPDCSETAIGTVFKYPLYITEEETARFRTTYDLDGNLLTYTVRPPQDINGRIVYRTNSL